jgi:hypothetical protein
VVGVALLLFGVASSAVLVAVGGYRMATRRYRDRAGTLLEGGRAVRAGLLVAVIGACELVITLLLYAFARS